MKRRIGETLKREWDATKRWKLADWIDAAFVLGIVALCVGFLGLVLVGYGLHLLSSH